MKFVYFIQAGRGGPIKIGVAVDPDRRLASLQGANPVDLRLLATQPGCEELERDLHQRFAEGHIRGEWFDPDTPGLLEAIADATKAHGEYVSRRDEAARLERIEARAVTIARNGDWDWAQHLMSNRSPRRDMP